MKTKKETKSMNGESLNILQDNLEKLKQLFPDVFSEGEIDIEKFKATFSDNINFSNERYVLNWAGKGDAFKVLQVPTTATLKPVPDESINFDTTQNIFIEGENLEVLKVLQKAYYGKVKCIIIDPPYNTGSDSFIYPDSFKENKVDYEKRVGDKDEEGFLMKEGLFRKNNKDSGHFHSNWLSMMYPRLFLAKNLLRDDGVIFVHIDDNEIHNLRLLMNEIFGEENFIANIIWQHSIQPKGYLGKFSVHHNYTLCFQKTNSFVLQSLERTDEHNKSYSNSDNDPKGLWRSGDVRNALYRPNLIYDITTPSGKTIAPPKNGWRWSKETIQKKMETGEIIFSEDETRIIRKIYLSTVEGRTPETIWFGKEVGTTRDASEELKELFNGNSPFDTPKPSKLIKKLIGLSNDSRDDIILDFFGGSGTTAHAVLELNKEDGGNRKFILVQLPELCDKESEAFKAGYKNIADISKERVKRVIKKVQMEIKGNKNLLNENENKNLDLGFKVFKLSPSNFKIWRGNEINEENLQQQLDVFTDPVSEGSEEGNMLYELMVKAGYELTDKVEKKNKYYYINDGELIIALEEMSQFIIDKIIVSKPKKVITLDNLFTGNDQLKTNTVLQMKEAGIEFKTI